MIFVFSVYFVPTAMIKQIEKNLTQLIFTCLLFVVFVDNSKKKVKIIFNVDTNSGAHMSRYTINHSVEAGLE